MLSITCPRCGVAGSSAANHCGTCGESLEAVRRSLVLLSDVAEIELENVAILGGSGFEAVAGDYVSVLFGPTTIELRSAVVHPNVTIPYAEIEDLELSGGTDVSGGGMIGGGFGLEGAAIGMAAATLFNAITTKTTTYTQIVITTVSGELFLLHGGTDPAVLRITLSHAFSRIRQERNQSSDCADH